MKCKKFGAILVGTSVMMMSFTGCMSSQAIAVEEDVTVVGTTQSNTGAQLTTLSTTTGIAQVDTSTMFTNRDSRTEYDESTSTVITLGSSETVSITEEGTYILRGTLTEGQVVVEVADTEKVQIVLDGVQITSSTSAPIYIKQADKVFITLADGTTNTLANGGTFVATDDNNVDGVIFSKTDLTLNGTGTLHIASTAGHGIVSKDDLVITGGTYQIEVSGHGLSGKDSIRIADGTFNLATGKDGLHSNHSTNAEKGFIYIEEGAFNIVAEGDGLDASGWIQLEGGSYQMMTAGGSAAAATKTDSGFGGRGMDKLLGNIMEPTTTTEEDSVSTKGIKADGNIIIKNGSYVIDAQDDTIHSNSDVIIADGSFQLTTGDDGIHADNNVTIYNGLINITKSYEGIEGATIDIKGGDITIVASDDGINAASSTDTTSRPGSGNDGVYLRIEGGIVRVSASGDGLDSNGNIYVTGGEVYVEGTVNGADSALDYDGTAQITGGTVVAVGMSSMAQNFGNTSTQASMLVTSQSMQQGEIILKDASGSTLLSYSPSKQYNAVVISTADMKEGETYTLTMGAETQTIQMTSLIYGSGGSMGGGGMRGNKVMGGENLGNEGITSNKPSRGEMQIPEGTEVPNGMQMPEGMEMPNGMQMPEGMEPPTGAEMPEGMMDFQGGKQQSNTVLPQA